MTHLDLPCIEVYVAHDVPLLWLARYGDALWLAVFADLDDNGETWLFAPVSEARMDDLRAGRVDLHDAFARTDDDTICVVCRSPDGTIRTDVKKASAIGDDMLPNPGTTLPKRDPRWTAAP